MFTEKVAIKIITQLKNITSIPIALFDVNKNLLSITNKEQELNRTTEEFPLYSLNELVGFFSIQQPVIPELVSFIQSFIEMSYEKHLLQNETFLPNQTIGKLIEAVESNTLTQEEIKKLEKRFSIFFVPPYQIAICKIEENSFIQKTHITHFFKKLPVLVYFFTDQHFCVISFQSSSSYFNDQLTKLASKLNSTMISFQLGISSSVISYHLLHRAFKEAMDAFYFSSNKKVCYEEIILESLIRSSHLLRREDYMNQTLKNLSDKYDDTIENFCKYNLNIANCSKAMYIHRNSLIYRLKKIHEITGLNPMNAEDLFLLKLALKIKKIDSL